MKKLQVLIAAVTGRLEAAGTQARPNGLFSYQALSIGPIFAIRRPPIPEGQLPCPVPRHGQTGLDWCHVMPSSTDSTSHSDSFLTRRVQRLSVF